MDLRAFYQRMREVEQTIAGDFAVVVSNATPDGGKSGVMTQVTRSTAAQLVAEGRASVATDDEAAQFKARQRPSPDRPPADSEDRPLATVLTAADVRQLRKRLRSEKE